MKYYYGLPDTIKQIFYYKRDPWNKPIICVCLLVHLTTHNVFARGIAICNRKDNCNKKIGRDIASGRAFRAYIDESKTGITASKNPKIFILRQDQDEDETRTFNYKSEYKPYLSSYEKLLIKNVFKLEVKTSETPRKFDNRCDDCGKPIYQGVLCASCFTKKSDTKIMEGIGNE